MDFIQFGGVGVISVMANVAAREMADMCRLAMAGQFAEAHAINQRLMPLHTKSICRTQPDPSQRAVRRWDCSDRHAAPADDADYRSGYESGYRSAEVCRFAVEFRGDLMALPSTEVAPGEGCGCFAGFTLAACSSDSRYKRQVSGDEVYLMPRRSVNFTPRRG